MFENAREKEKKDNYEIVGQYGFFKPTLEDRQKIKIAFEKINISLYGRGYDLIDTKTKNAIVNNNLDNIINEICLYELKTTWQVNIQGDFKGFTFGITENEIRNYLSLKHQYKIVFLNGPTQNISIRFFKEIAEYFSHIAYFFAVGNTSSRNIIFEDINLQ